MTSRIPLPAALDSAAFSVRTALTQGLGRGRLRSTDLASPFYGVRTPSRTLGLRELCLAYNARMPAHAFFSGVTAALIMGVPLPHELESSRALRVSVPTPHRAPEGTGIRGSSVHVGLTDVRHWGGLRISSPGRLWCELASSLGVLDLVAAGDFLIHHQNPLCTRADLAMAIARYRGRRGLRVLREAFALLDEGSESPQESRLRTILLRASVPWIVANLPITTSGGYRYRGDLAIPGSRVIIEYQSDYHADLAQFRRDMTRRSRLEADGWVVIFVTADELRDPTELVQRVRLVLASRTLF